MITRWTDQPTDDLVAALEAGAEETVRVHWTRYLKGAAVFRGVPMGGIRSSLRSVWHRHHLAERDIADLVALAHRWFSAEPTEDKLAAVLLLAEQVPDRLTLSHVDALALPLARGDIADWNVCDWYATKALHAFLTHGRQPADELPARAGAIATWSTAPGLWQRRAGVVAFVKLAPGACALFDSFVPLVLDACAANLVDQDRFAHTGPGWVLRELSRAVPDAVAAFVEGHPELSAEGRRMATARLRSGPYRRR